MCNQTFFISAMKKIKYNQVRKVQPTHVEYSGLHKNIETDLQLFVYDETQADEFLYKKDIESLTAHVDFKKNNWLNLHGLNEPDIIKQIGDYFSLESFIVNDIINTSRRNLLDEVDDLIFISIKSILPTKNNHDNIQVEQISFVLKENTLLSFQERKGDFFTHIRERIRTNVGIIRKKKTDYLLYLMLDAVMENFFITIDTKEDIIEELLLESKINSSPIILEQIEKHREDLNFIKRSIIPLKDALLTIKSVENENHLVSSQNRSYFSRLHQKCLELLDQIEFDMNSLESASSFFFSAQNHRLNEIMKTLTIVASIFIPLTFIVGIYGMNFENMPELKYKNAYFVTLGVMFIICILMVYYFKKKKWF